MEKEFKPTKPNYKGTIQVSAWEKVDKKGITYLSIKLDNRFNLFQIPKE